MSQRPSHPISGPMITYTDGNAGAELHSGQQGFVNQEATGRFFETIGLRTGTVNGVSMSFSGPVHVHVDNMYMYDVGAQFHRVMHFTHAPALENGLIAPILSPATPAATAPAKTPRKRNPPKKKASVSDPAPPAATGNGNDSGDSNSLHSD